MIFRTLDDYQLSDKKILVRVDLNVPIEDGRISDTSRIERLIPTIKKIINSGGFPVLMSHFGRPKGLRTEELSLKHLVPSLKNIFGHPVQFSKDIFGVKALKIIKNLNHGEVLLLENTRFYKEEEKNDFAFSKRLSELGDIFCNDAFSASHRKHASTVGIAKLMPNCIGLLMHEELENLKKVLTKPKRPVVAVVGGAKVSTKLDLLLNLIKKVDHIVIGGGMANTFLHAQGHVIGKSLCEKNLKDTALKIFKESKTFGCQIHIPQDAIISSVFEANAPNKVVDVRKIPDESLVLDIGPRTCNKIKEIFSKCKTLIWNGPLGAFELTPFDKGTNFTTVAAAKLTIKKQLISVAGGGDTVSALKKAGVINDFTYVSLAGGAFLEWMEGKELPGISCLN